MTITADKTLVAHENLTAEELVAPVADEIRRAAAEAEAVRRLPDSLMNRLKEAGLFSIYTPRQFGGIELPLPDALRVVEEVSRHDGSTGWTVALGLSNSAFTSVLPECSAARVLGNGAALITAAPAFTARAVSVDGGYRITGRWPFNSGAPNADWICGVMPVFDGDAPRVSEGQPEMIVAFISPADVQIIDTWYVTGLRASGTQDVCVDSLFVPEDMTGQMSLPQGPRAVRECALTHIPFFTLAGFAQAPAVCLGLGRRTLEEFKNIALTKRNPMGPPMREQVQVQVALARAEALVRSARTYWYEEIQTVWEFASGGCQFSPQDRAAMRMASVLAVQQCVEATDLLYRFAGSTAIFQSSPIERCWRDIHTAAQHLQVHEGRWEAVGRVLLDLDAGSPIL
jgi:alkylation response protein AidB-like acyl-CoA dehydrogenase